MGSNRLRYLGIDQSSPVYMGWNPGRDLRNLGRKFDEERRRAEDSALDLAKATHDKVKAEAGRFVKKVEDTRKRVTAEAGRAVKNVAGAAEAVARFTERELRAARDNLTDTAEALADGENPLKVAWRSATSPIKTSNYNLLRAVQESPLLATAASIAASVYGGPAGSAAFSAWMAFNASGGDFSTALRVGVTQGLTSYATAVVAKLPVGQREIAAAALSSAKAQLAGANSEETRAAAIASLLDSISGHVPAADLDIVQQALVTGATNGLAVAASDGNAEDIRDAFLKSGGQIIVQAGKSELAEAKAEAESQIAAQASSLLDDTDLEMISQLHDEIAGRRSEIDQALATAKAGLAGQIAEAKKAADTAKARVQALQASIDAGIGELESIANVSREELSELKTKADAEAASLNPGKVSLTDLSPDVQTKLAEIEHRAGAAAIEIEATAAKLAAEADVRIDGLEAELQEMRATVLDETLLAGGAAGVRAVTGDLLISWDFDHIDTAKKAVVLTFAGAGSVVDEHLKGLIDTDAAPEKIIEKLD